MTVSGLASIATFNMDVGDEPNVNMAVTSNGLPLANGPEIVSNQEKDVSLSASELRAMDKQVRTRRDAQVFLSAGAINSATTFYKEVADTHFAVDVNVDVDLSQEGTPEATIRKMRNILTANSSVASPTKKDIGVTLTAMSIMSDARMKMQKQVGNEAFGIPRVAAGPGTDFSMNMGTDNFSASSHTDSLAMNFRTNNKLTGLLVNTFA